jgi:molybdopterin-guanine dinucleotide biosynthesis protein A
MPEETSTISSVTGVVLAGGQGQRMGGSDKARLKLGGSTLLSRVVDGLARQTSRVVVNSNTPDELQIKAARAVISDRVAGFAGPLAGVEAALHWNSIQPNPSDYILSVATDTPFFPSDLAAQMTQVADGRPIIAIAQSRGINQPVFGLWPAVIRLDLSEWLKDKKNRKVMAFVRMFDHEFVEFPPYKHGEIDVDPFFNINTPEDLAQADEMVRHGL